MPYLFYNLKELYQQWRYLTFCFSFYTACVKHKKDNLFCVVFYFSELFLDLYLSIFILYTGCIALKYKNKLKHEKHKRKVEDVPSDIEVIDVCFVVIPLVILAVWYMLFYKGSFWYHRNKPYFRKSSNGGMMSND